MNLMSKVENSNNNPLLTHISYLLDNPGYLPNILASKNNTYFGILLNWIIKVFVHEFDPNVNVYTPLCQSSQPIFGISDVQ